MPNPVAPIEIVDVLNQDVLAVDNEIVSVVELKDEETLIVEEVEIELISEGFQGPPGPAGIAEEEMPYAERTDFVGENIIYKGWAVPGSLTTQPVWRVQRIVIDDVNDDVSKQWANGTALFDKVWDDRASLTYI